MTRCQKKSKQERINFIWLASKLEDLFRFFKQLHPCTKKQCLVNILRAIRGAVTLIKGNAFGPKLHTSRHQFWILIVLGRQLLFMSFLGEKLKWEGKLNWKLAPDKAVILMLLLGLTKKLKLIVKGLRFANPGRCTWRHKGQTITTSTSTWPYLKGITSWRINNICTCQKAWLSWWNTAKSAWMNY